MARKRKFIIASSIVVVFLAIPVILYYLALYSFFRGDGPSPGVVLIVSSFDYEVGTVLDAIEEIKGSLGSRIDKKAPSSGNNFYYYKHAYWYPYSGSDTFGIAVVEWDTTTWEKDDHEMGGSYFIDVYSDNENCVLCAQLKSALLRSNIEFKSPCESPDKLTKYEHIRCDI